MRHVVKLTVDAGFHGAKNSGRDEADLRTRSVRLAACTKIGFGIHSLIAFSLPRTGVFCSPSRRTSAPEFDRPPKFSCPLPDPQEPVIPSSPRVKDQLRGVALFIGQEQGLAVGNRGSAAEAARGLRQLATRQPAAARNPVAMSACLKRRRSPSTSAPSWPVKRAVPKYKSMPSSIDRAAASTRPMHSRMRRTRFITGLKSTRISASGSSSHTAGRRAGTRRRTVREVPLRPSFRP